MRDFHVLQTEVQVMMDFMGRCMRIWVRISGGRESHIASSVNNDLENLGKLSDIAAVATFN